MKHDVRADSHTARVPSAPSPLQNEVTAWFIKANKEGAFPWHSPRQARDYAGTSVLINNPVWKCHTSAAEMCRNSSCGRLNVCMLNKNRGWKALSVERAVDFCVCYSSCVVFRRLLCAWLQLCVSCAWVRVHLHNRMTVTIIRVCVRVCVLLCGGDWNRLWQAV